MPRFRLPQLLQRRARGQRVAPEVDTRSMRWFEAVLIPALGVGLAWYFSPRDPLQALESIPWVWFAPTLVALRYGVSPGLIACLPLIANWYLADRLGLVPERLGLEYFVGGGLLVLVCGEFSDIWRDRNLRIEETNVYLAERLSRITKRHLLLNLSHDRLEHEMLVRPSSLRDALVQLRDIAITADDGTAGPLSLPGARKLLQLLVHYVNLEAATIYALQPDARGPALGAEVARVGDPLALDTDDEMLVLAMEREQLVHIASEELSLNRTTHQLVVAPLVAGVDQMIGMLAVTSMPFYSLNAENLQMLSVILGYYADSVMSGPDVREIQRRLPGVPAQFAEELARMRQLQRRSGLLSQILVMRFEGEGSRTIPAEFLRIKRGLDVYWQLEVGGEPVIAVLMPLATPAAMAGFVQRIEQWLAHRFDGTPDSLGVRLRRIDFSDEDPVETLVTLLQETQRQPAAAPQSERVEA